MSTDNFNKKISDAIDPHKLATVALKTYWAIDQLENEQKDRYTANEIAVFLVEKHKIKASRQAIEYALKGNKKNFDKNKKGYKLMETGRKELEQINADEKIVIIEAGKPFSTKNIKLKDIFSTLTGVVNISDPYLDLNTLDLIFKNIDPSLTIRILTNNIADKPSGIFKRHLGELISEGLNIEVRIYPKYVLHDRYIIDDASFWLSGNSLNHLGNKESFLIRLGNDVRQSMLATFNNRWKISNTI